MYEVPSCMSSQARIRKDRSSKHGSGKPETAPAVVASGNVRVCSCGMPMRRRQWDKSNPAMTPREPCSGASRIEGAHCQRERGCRTELRTDSTKVVFRYLEKRIEDQCSAESDKALGQEGSARALLRAVDRVEYPI